MLSVGDGAVTHEVLPDVPRKARDTISGTVNVKVKVAVDTVRRGVARSFGFQRRERILRQSSIASRAAVDLYTADS